VYIKALVHNWMMVCIIYKENKLNVCVRRLGTVSPFFFAFDISQNNVRLRINTTEDYKMYNGKNGLNGGNVK
jgi:hypothetical protein